MPERFKFTFDPASWQLARVQGLDQLDHLGLSGCILRPAAGMGLPPDMSAENTIQQIGEVRFEVVKVRRGDELVFVNYFTGDPYYTGFMVTFTGAPRDCLQAAEAVLGSFLVVAAP